jgi:hypothetical protein
VRARVRIDLVVALAMLGALLVANATTYAPRRARLESISTKADQLQREFGYLAAHTQDLTRFAEFLPGKNDHGRTGDQRFLSSVSAETKRLGITLGRIEPVGEDPYGQYMKRTYKLQIEGGYRSFVRFLEFLEGLPEVVLVTSFDLKSSILSASARNRADIEISVVGY